MLGVWGFVVEFKDKRQITGSPKSINGFHMCVCAHTLCLVTTL